MTNKNPNQDTRFKPGQSGNPSGRPKGSVSLLTTLKKKLADNDGKLAKELVDATIRDAKKGDSAARKLCWEYVEGKPKENMGEPLENIVRIIDDV